MKNKFLKFLLFFFLACVSWGKYMWDKSQENDTIIFKVIAVILLLTSFYFLALGILKLIEKKESKDDEHLMEE